MATNPEERSKPLVNDNVQNHTALKQAGPFSNGDIASFDGGDKKSSQEEPVYCQEEPDNTMTTAISGPPPSGPPPSGLSGGYDASSQPLFSSSPYNIGQADGSAFISGSMACPGSIAQNSAYSAAQNSAYSSAQSSAGGGHVIGEANLSAGMSMGSNAAVSHQLGISQMPGMTGPYGTDGMSGRFGGSSGQFPTGLYPNSSGKMAMPGEMMGTVTLPIFNMSPYPVPVNGSSQAGQQQQSGNQARFHNGYMNAGAPVGETEWHRSDGGDHQTHHMREGSSASSFGNVLMSQTQRQPLSQENVLAMQRQDESLLANMMAHAHLSENEGPQNADVGRTDSKRGLRGAMKPQHSSTSNLAGSQQ